MSQIGNFLNEGKVGRIATDAQAQVRKQINERWEKLGFTKGLSGYLKENMSVLFENQANQTLKSLNEATDSSNSGSFETVVFPLVRRVFSRLLANDIVSVQAMNMPIGKLFFIKPVTSERQWKKKDGSDVTDFAIEDGMTGEHVGLMGYERTNRRDGSKENRYYLPDDAVNTIWEYKGKTYASRDEAVAAAKADSKTEADVVAKNPTVTSYMKKSLYDLFYNDFLYDNSKGKVHIKVGTVESAQIGTMGDYSKPTTLPVNNLDGTIRNVIVAVSGFSQFNNGKLTGPDGNEMDSETFLASLKVVAKAEIASTAADADTGKPKTTGFAQGEEIFCRVVTQRYGKGIVEKGTTVDAQGKIYLELDLAKPVTGTVETIDGYVGVDSTKVTAANVKDMFQVAWAQYDSLELETEIGEVSFELSDVVVSVEERKLRATWSPEMSQDVAAFHNIDAEAELTAILSEQIAAEVDREILRDLRKGAPWQLNWDYNGFRRTGKLSTNYTQKDWNQTLVTKVNQVSAQIHKSTLRGSGNFIVVSSEISAIFNDLEYFHVTDANAEATTYSMGIEKVGSLQGRYQVYVDPYSPAYSMIIGHKGDSLLDTGYIYAPYVPMQLTPVIYNASNFAPVRGILTRYAKKMVNNRYYGAIKVQGLQTWDINELR